MTTAFMEPPPAVHHGPTWEPNPLWRPGQPAAQKYVLPERSLGWHILWWISKNLRDDEGGPFKPTAEQSRFILWMYAVDEHGSFTYRDIVLQRIKGWGKDPLAAVIAAVEFVGPSRFSHFAAKDIPHEGILKGDPIGRRHPRAWVQIAAVSQTQTRNTMQIFAGLFTELCKATHGIDLGKEVIYAYGGQAQIQSVTSNPRTMEGNRPTFVIMNETHHWLEANNGWEMSGVIKRNLRKNKRGGARALAITNAYDPSEFSVAQKRRETWEDQEQGAAIRVGVLYDSLEAHEDALLNLPRLVDEEGEPLEDDNAYEGRIRRYLTSVVLGVRGDAWWLAPEEIVAGILDGETPPGDARRFYYNQVKTSEDAWLDAQAITRATDPLCLEARRTQPDDPLRAGWIIRPEEEIVLFFDGSKSRDHTALVACRVSDGMIFTMGHWAPPPAARGKVKRGWLAPRGEIKRRIKEIFDRFTVVGFFADPSHAQDDDDSAAYWVPMLDDLHREHKDDLLLWSAKTGNNQHSIIWDMSSPTHQQEFVAAAERFVDEMEARNDIEEFVPTFMHDGYPELVKHMAAAKMYPHPKGYGTSLWKGSRVGERKIDLAVAAVGARMVRRMYLNRDPEDTRQFPGQVWSY